MCARASSACRPAWNLAAALLAGLLRLPPAFELGFSQAVQCRINLGTTVQGLVAQQHQIATGVQRRQGRHHGRADDTPYVPTDKGAALHIANVCHQLRDEYPSSSKLQLINRLAG